MHEIECLVIDRVRHWPRLDPVSHSLPHIGLIFGAVIAGAWYGWKIYGRRYAQLGGNSDPFGRGGGGLMWADKWLIASDSERSQAGIR